MVIGGLRFSAGQILEVIQRPAELSHNEGGIVLTQPAADLIGVNPERNLHGKRHLGVNQATLSTGLQHRLIDELPGVDSDTPVGLAPRGGLRVPVAFILQKQQRRKYLTEPFHSPRVKRSSPIEQL